MLSKESVIDMAPYLNSRIRVKIGDREVTGMLKAFDRIPNLILDDAVEESAEAREIGIVILRGQMISSIMPDSLREIENPFK